MEDIVASHEDQSLREENRINQSETDNQIMSGVATYKVGCPPRKKLMAEFAGVLKEAFFSDDPLRAYKDKTWSRKLMLCLQYLFPILDWGRDYDVVKFKGDVLAGLTIASLSVPQGIGYAKLANLESQYGIYPCFVPPIVYALMGSSRDLAIGTVAVISLLLGSLLQDEIDPINNKEEYLRLAFTATFFAGITQALLGVSRLGFLIDFLSHAAIVGFMAGAAVTIALQQLKGFFGIEKFTKKTDVISVLESVLRSFPHGWNWPTIFIGANFLVLLFVAKHMGKKNKKLFWLPAITPIISIAMSTFFVYATHAERHGVQIVKHIKKGMNPISFELIYFSGPMLGKGLKIGIISAMVSLTEAVAIGRTFAAKKDYQLDGSKEMIALGTMNIVGSMTSCYVATGSFSRSAVNYMAGCHTPVSNLVMSLSVLFTLLVITPLFKYTPNSIISSIVISAVTGLIDYDAAILIWKVDKFDFIACMGAFLGVAFASVEKGLLIAVVISFAKILLQVTRPKTVILGNLPGTALYRNTDQYPDAIRVPGVLVVRVDSAIYFTNSNYVKERILRWLSDEEEKLKINGFPQIEFLVVEMSPVTDIDTSGIHALEALHKSLQKRKIQLALVNPGPVVMEKFNASGFIKLAGSENIFLAVGDAVNCFRKSMENV